LCSFNDPKIGPLCETIGMHCPLWLHERVRNTRLFLATDPISLFLLFSEFSQSVSHCIVLWYFQPTTCAIKIR
jgi:hypothetical protein